MSSEAKITRPCELTLTEAASALAAGDLSPAALLEDCLARVDESEGAIKAWNSLDRDAAMIEAHRIARTPYSGPLWGVPIAIKDIVDVRGFPTTASSKVLSDRVVSADAPLVARLRDAGAVILGKTNTQEFAYGCVTPPTTNPWNPGRIPGGSSGGSAAAVAAGHCPVAIGTDTAGSIRIPSALCGVAGLKTRRETLPMDGIIPLAPTLDAAGPIARTPEDLALVWEALGEKIGEQLGFRIGVPAEEVFPDLDPDVRRTYAEALEVLGGLAENTAGVSLPSFHDFDFPRSAVLMVEALEVHREAGWWPSSADLYTEETRSYLEYAERMFATTEGSGLDRYPIYHSSLETCRELGSRWNEAAATVDAIVTPALPRAAPTHEEAAEVDEGSPRRPVVIDLTRLPAPANVAGLAAVSVPAGLSRDGLPVGIQLVGREEGRLLEIAAAFDREAGWSRHRPPVRVAEK